MSLLPLRGRTSELARVSALLDSCADGAGEVLVIEGAAGIGKSRLLAQAQLLARAAGFTVAADDADELDQVTPWGPLLRAFGSSEPPVLDRSALGSLRGLLDQRLAVVEAMQAALEAAAARGPLLIVLDDVQWADPPTLLALGLLPPALFSYPVGWLLARRPWPASAQLSALLTRLDGAGATRLRLGPLSAEEAAELAADLSSAEPGAGNPALPDLVAAAEGNPLYLAELLKADPAVTPGRRAGSRSRAGSSSGSGTEDVPERVRSAILAHLRPLSEPARRLLQVASVLGREFTATELAAMTGQQASTLLPAVEEAIGAELVAETGSGLAFRHDLLRQAVYAGLPASMRTALHHDAAAALRRTGAPVVRIATQLAVGAVPGDETAIAAMIEAAHELAPASPGAGADLALRVLDLMGAGDQRRAGLMLAAVRMLVLAGRQAEAFAVGDRFLDSMSGPPGVEAELQLELRFAWTFDRFDAYPVPLPPHLLTDPAVDKGVAVALLALEQMPRIWEGRGDEAEQALGQAQQVVTEGSQAFQTVTQMLVVSSMHRGRFDEALDRASAALRRGHGSAELESLAAMMLQASGRITESIEMMRAALASAGSSGRALLRLRYRWLYACMLVIQGNLEDAHAEARSGIDLAVELGYVGSQFTIPVSVLIEVDLRRGEIDAARAALAEFAPMAGGVLPDMLWTTALVADACGDHARVLAALGPIREQFEAGSFSVATASHHRLPMLVHLALRAGDRALAEALADGATAQSGLNPQVTSLTAAAYHAQALVCRDPAVARQTAARAVELAGCSDARLLEAAAREDLGRLLAAGGPAGSPAEATEQLEAAYEFYVRAGAHHDTARVRAALRTLGVRKRQSSVARPKQGWGSLTRSEQAVVDLVAEGLTNREVAARLFLSPDTVNSHLRHAFTKLGLRSRVQLARIAAEHASASGETGVGSHSPGPGPGPGPGRA